VAHKGIDTVLHVVAALLKEHPTLRYAVVGSGPMQAQLEALALTLGVASRVRFLTDVPDADLPGLYNSAEIYLGVSRPAELMMEGFGISLSEASACGIPVVGGSSGGIPDAVIEGETGLRSDSSWWIGVSRDGWVMAGEKRSRATSTGIASRLMFSGSEPN
jgi:phosphatidylinositol alpha-1,6-mannosyltransferase